MGKKKEHPVLKEMFPVTLDHLDKKKIVGKPSIDNVHDDAIWGKDWDRARYAAAEQLKKRKARETEEYNAYIATQKAASKNKEARIAANPRGPFEWSRFSTAGKKYHITPDGQARPCRAEVRSCPYGSADHFGVEEGVWVDAQKIANWIVERRNNATATTTAFDLDPKGTENPRAMAREARATAMARGARANIIEVEATIDLDFARQPVKISRKIGNTVDNRWADHAYWVLDDGIHEPRITDQISEAELSEFVTYYLDTAAQQEDDEIRTEIAEELRSRIREIMQVAEGEAARAQEGSAHYSTVQLSLDEELHFEDDLLGGKVNYAASGFEPGHIKNIAERNGKAITGVHIGEGFEVFDSEAGDGTASWKMVKGQEGWEVTVQGTRGDVTLFQAESPGEAEAKFRETFTQRVRAQDPRKGRYFGEDLPSEETDSSFRAEERATFVRELVTEDHRLSGKLTVAAAQDSLYGPAEGESIADQVHMEKIFDLLD